MEQHMLWNANWQIKVSSGESLLYLCDNDNNNNNDNDNDNDNDMMMDVYDSAKSGHGAEASLH